MTKNICISGYYGFDNFGDETILKVLVENLKKFLIEPNITVFSVNPIKTAEKLNVNSIQTFSFKEIIKSLYKCDCLISGGGSLLQDVTSTKSLIYYLGVISIAKLFQKKIIVFAQGIGPIKNPLLKRLTKFLLKKATYITVRDEDSLNLLKSWGIEAKKCNDPVWNININEKVETGKIGIQLRTFPTLTNNFINELAKVINKNYSDKEINIISCQNKLDLTPSNKLKEILKDLNPKIVVDVIENTSDDKLVQDICDLDELIAMRYHACLIGIKSNVKVLPMIYDIKVEALSKDFNLKTIDMTSFDNIAKTIEEFKNSCWNCDMSKVNSLKFDFEEFVAQL